MLICNFFLGYDLAGYSEDSDYTSDLNYPITQNANSSASQYRNLRTPQRSLETSRENSYEKDDRNYDTYYDTTGTMITSRSTHNNQTNMQHSSNQMPIDDDYQYSNKDENDPLFYNSRPLNSNNMKLLNGSRYGTQNSYSGKIHKSM